MPNVPPAMKERVRFRLLASFTFTRAVTLQGGGVTRGRVVGHRSPCRFEAFTLACRAKR
jgi:hypothetical protein